MDLTPDIEPDANTQAISDMGMPGTPDMHITVPDADPSTAPTGGEGCTCDSSSRGPAPGFLSIILAFAVLSWRRFHR